MRVGHAGHDSPERPALPPVHSATPEPARTGGDPTLAALRRGDLAGATTLTLRAGLTELPREVLGLGDTLEQLDLSGNALTVLPADFGRLKRLKVFFASGNRFERLPPVLGDCPSLSQVGLRGCGLRELPGEALPPQLRWLTLTDNAIEQLPPALGQRPALQKLMLAGNRLSALPASLAGARQLELLRLSANRFDTWPGWLTELPRLAWLAWAGNPLEPAPAAAPAPNIAWQQLRWGEQLGEGASGHIHQAWWQAGNEDGSGGSEPRAVAVKLFKGQMTSDGLPEQEMAACLAAGAHPHLSGALGRLSGHPLQAQGLVMPLLPAHWRALAAPPSLASCSRDVYDPALRLDAPVVMRLARASASAAAHLHARGLSHGDLYAHNLLWDGAQGEAVLSDFGAASALPPGALGERLQRLDVRAWGLLAQELIARCDTPLPALERLAEACVQPRLGARPAMAEVLGQLPA